MEYRTTQIHDLVKAARATQKVIQELQHQLSTLNIPVLSDTSLLQSIYTAVQSQMSSANTREQRLCFVFIAAWLYCPSSIIANHPLKPGLRTAISRIIGRCKGEVSQTFTEAKFRYDHLERFRDKIDEILAKYLHSNN